MLLYVNKKEIRRKKIKFFLIILSIVLFLTANIINFKQKLHTPTENLNSYQTVIKKPLLPSNIPVVEVFLSKNKKIKHILIPQNITKEVAYKIVKSLKTNQNTTNVFLTDELKENSLLQQIINYTNHKISENITKKTTIITSNIEFLSPLIYKEKLYPKSITYSYIKDTDLQNIINNFFSKDFIPQNSLEQEQNNLQIFVKDHQKELINLINNAKLTDIYYPKQHSLLKNTSFCLQTNIQTICNTKQNISFIKSLRQTLNELSSNEKPQKLIILTSLKEIPDNINLKDSGLLFKYEERQAILLPEQITSSSYNDIKIKAGINPSYKTNAMKYYQFKTVEIDLNDNI